MLVATSTRAIWNGGAPYAGIVELLTSLGQQASVAVVSNSEKPSWFDEHFVVSGVKFFQIIGRQGGKDIRNWAQSNNVPMHRVLVLGASQDDVAMAKNSGAVLVSAGWGADRAAMKVGLRVDRPEDVVELARLVREWGGQSYLRAEGANYTVVALCDASSHGYTTDGQRLFGKAVAQAVKQGTPELNHLLTVTVGSLMRARLPEQKSLLWGVYPSSSMLAADKETLSDFTDRLRTTISRVQFAKRGEPLFLRHRKAPKRSAGQGGKREDPTSEVESLRLNPFYKGSRLRGRHVIVVDDITTYGVSMGVAAGFLRAAGAVAVTGVAVGKLGHRLGCYDVRIGSDPFEPVSAGGWSHNVVPWSTEVYSEEDQSALRRVLSL